MDWDYDVLQEGQVSGERDIDQVEDRSFNAHGGLRFLGLSHYHIVEDPGGIEHLVDCEVPTEKYYEELAKDMRARHPKTSRFLLDN